MKIPAIALALLCALLLAAPLRAAEPYDLQVIVPLSGGGAFAGTGQQAMLQAFEAMVNKDGGIKGQDLRLVFHDDQSSPQVAVQLATELLAAHPSVILGSSLVAMCAAIAPLVKNGPVQYCLSPGLHPTAGSYSFSVSAGSFDQIEALMRYFRLKGWAKIAVLTATDATGQDADRAIERILGLPDFSTMQKVDHEHFNPGDVSVAAQIERVKASGAQCLIAWITGTPVATALKGAIQAGLDIPIGTSSGNQTFAQLALYTGFMPKDLVLPSGLFPEHDGIVSLDPRVEKEQHAMYAVLKERGLRSDNMTGTSWDAALIVVAALRQLGTGASAEQIRQYIANLTDFPGVGGIYDFKSYPERGLGPDSATIVRYDPQGPHWVWLSQPGGTPLK